MLYIHHVMPVKYRTCARFQRNSMTWIKLDLNRIILHPQVGLDKKWLNLPRSLAGLPVPLVGANSPATWSRSHSRRSLCCKEPHPECSLGAALSGWKGLTYAGHIHSHMGSSSSVGWCWSILNHKPLVGKHIIGGIALWNFSASESDHHLYTLRKAGKKRNNKQQTVPIGFWIVVS